MVTAARAKTLCLLAGLAISAGAPCLARSEPALYTGSVHLRLWERSVPYGASLSGPGLVNASPGNTVSLGGSGSAAFTLPSGQLSLITSMSEPATPTTTLDSRKTSFSGTNDAGTFFAGGAPDSTGYAPLYSLPAAQFGVSFSAEPGRFGGVMKLLGHFDWQGELANCSYCTYRTNIPLSPIGGPFAGTAQAFAYLGGSYQSPTFVTATVWGFPWDTGVVGAVAAVARTYSSTTASAEGTDLRSASGMGTLQLVTPFLVRVKSHPPDCGGCENKWFYAGTARAELRFVPEPGATTLLAAGTGFLLVLFRHAKRRDA